MEFTEKQKQAFAYLSKGFALFAEGDATAREDTVNPAESFEDTLDISEYNLVQLKKLAEAKGIDPNQKRAVLVDAIQNASADVSADADENADAVTADSLKEMLEEFEDSELLDILADAKIKTKGKRSALLQAIADAVNAGKIDLNDYFEDGDTIDDADDNDDDNAADDDDDDGGEKSEGYDASELVSDWSDKDIKDLLTENSIKYGRKASRDDLIGILQTALDDEKIDLSEYEFEE